MGFATLIFGRSRGSRLDVALGDPVLGSPEISRRKGRDFNGLPALPRPETRPAAWLAAGAPGRGSPARRPRKTPGAHRPATGCRLKHRCDSMLAPPRLATVSWC